jgi:hypothetical protein
VCVGDVAEGGVWGSPCTADMARDDQDVYSSVEEKAILFGSIYVD